MTSPFNAEGVGFHPGWGAKIAHALCPKNRSKIVTHSIKSLNMVHIKILKEGKPFQYITYTRKMLLLTFDLPYKELPNYHTPPLG